MGSLNKKPRTLNEAYSEMLKSVRGEALGESRQRLFAIRKAADRGDFPKEETMRSHLKMAGWKCVHSELWVAAK